MNASLILSGLVSGWSHTSLARRYICRERFPTDYFQFNCPEVGSPWLFLFPPEDVFQQAARSSITPEASMTGWNDSFLAFDL